MHPVVLGPSHPHLSKPRVELLWLDAAIYTGPDELVADGGLLPLRLQALQQLLSGHGAVLVICRVERRCWLQDSIQSATA